MMKKNSILILNLKKKWFLKNPKSQSCRLTHITNINIIFSLEQFE